MSENDFERAGEKQKKHKLLTQAAVDNAKGEVARRELPDGKIPGLFLIVQPSGAKSWALRYRNAGKIGRKFTHPDYPLVSLSDARKWALAWQSAIKNQKADPAGKKQSAKLPSNSVSARFQKFLKEHVANLSEASEKENKRLWEKNIKPEWEHRPLSEITKQDARDLISKAAESGKVLSNRVHSLLSKFFNWCIEQDLLEKSPMLGVKKLFSETARKRTLSEMELRAVWNVAPDMPAPLGDLVRLSLLTVQRPRDDISQMQWSDFDLTKAVWTVRGEQTKNGQPHTLPLSPQALAILKGLPRVTGPDGKPSRWVFTRDGAKPYALSSKRLAALRKKVREAGAEPAPNLPESEREWHWHDFRRTGYTLLQAQGVAKEVTRHIANHKTGKDINPIDHVYGVYEFAEEKRTALNALANEIERIARPLKNVVPLQAAS